MFRKKAEDAAQERLRAKGLLHFALATLALYTFANRIIVGLAPALLDVPDLAVWDAIGFAAGMVLGWFGLWIWGSRLELAAARILRPGAAPVATVGDKGDVHTV